MARTKREQSDATRADSKPRKFEHAESAAPALSPLILYPNLGKRSGPHVPLDEYRHIIMVMRANGASIGALALALRLSESTLRKYYAFEIDHGFDMVKTHVAAAIVNAALAGNIAAAKFWLASRCEEWRAAKHLLEDQPEDDGAVVRFYLPSNRRDEPEEDDGPTTIEGEVAA